MEAHAGSNIGFGIQNINLDQLSRGFVASDANNSPAIECVSFDA